MNSVSSQVSGDLLITGGRLVDGDGSQRDNPGVRVRDGRLVALGADALAATRAATERVNADGWVIAPGFIDLCCNLREPGNGQKGNIASEAGRRPTEGSPRCALRRKHLRSTTPAPSPI